MSVKSLDGEGRWRDITIGFRVSEEKNERINQLAALSGMTKQSPIIDWLEGSEITAFATTSVQKTLAIQAKRVADELARAAAGSPANARLMDASNVILDVLKQMNDQGMTIDDCADGLTLEEMELSDTTKTMTPEEMKPVAYSEKGKPERRRKSAKGMFKKDRK